MIKYSFLKGAKAAGAFSALMASLLLLTSCGTKLDVPNRVDENTVEIPVTGGTDIIIEDPAIIETPIVGGGTFENIKVMVRTDPADPHNERFLDDWRFQVFNIDDQARAISPTFYGETGPDGNALIGLPPHMYGLPLVITAYNDVFPLDCDADEVHADECECRQYEIFVPPFCYDKAVWLLGPLEDSLWRFYKRAAERRGESWNPSQVDCGTWLANLQALILTDEIADELHDLSDRDDMRFHEKALIEAFQENQRLLVPTRPPICMAERRHNGGGMERRDAIPAGLTVTLDEDQEPWVNLELIMVDNDPIVVSTEVGLPTHICGEIVSEEPSINLPGFTTFEHGYYLDEDDFMGVIFDSSLNDRKLDFSSYVVKLGNGRELEHDKYDDACAVTNILEFTNRNDDEQDIVAGNGVTYTNLLGGGAMIHTTSDGDDQLENNDTWVIFMKGEGDNAVALVVELLGHRQEDFRDVLHMTFDGTDLFIGLRADYELNEEEVDGERSFLGYTMHLWDQDPYKSVARRNDIANCYEAADVWARQFFVTDDFQEREDECCFDDECEIKKVIYAKKAAEFAARSQCFSNSRANQRWRTDDVGYWSMNTHHGVHGNVIINAGWLAPALDFEIYIQKFDEAVFKGPRTIRRTDDCGQLLVELPTLVEGDRVLIKSEDNCCDDYDLVVPCVPEFTGFVGAPGIPYVPVTVSPPPPFPGAPIPGVPVP